MKKQMKTWLSLLLCVIMGIGEGTVVFAEPAETKQQLNPLVAVIESVAKGTEMDLTEEGELDWVHITGKKVNRKAGVQEVIQYKNLDENSPLSTASDSAMVYAWSDGTPDAVQTGNKTAGVFNYKSGDSSSINIPIEQDAGYQITLPEADEVRTLSFVSGIWQAKASIEICVNGSETPIYTTELKAAGDAKVNRYDVTIRQGNSVTVTTKIKEKSHKSGNLSLGAITLKDVEPSPISVKIQDAAERETMDLTENGDVDWMHLTSEEINRKKDVTNQISFVNLGTDAITTMKDAKTTYSWSDGAPTENMEKNTKGAVFSYKNGDQSTVGVELSEPAGYQLMIPPADYEREITFASGVWRTEAQISIVLDGEDAPIYENRDLSSGASDPAINKIYTVDVAAGKGLTVTGKILKKNHTHGNFNLQAVTLSERLTLNDYKLVLQDKLAEVKKLNEADYEEFYVNQLRAEAAYSESLLGKENVTDKEYYIALLFLSEAYESCMKAETPGEYTYDSNSGLTSSFGWEGDLHAPIAYLDGSYKLKDNNNLMITFGVKDIPGKIKWYNAEEYLPCFISEYSKDDMNYKVENFANKHTIDGNDYVIAYSRMTVTNNSQEEKSLPKVSQQLVALNNSAKNQLKVQPEETVTREYAIGADRFNSKYAFPESDKIEAQGSFDDNYGQMKQYWNNRIEPLTQLNLPDEQLVNAYKAGFIYTLIVRDDIDGEKRLHVGENGYDKLYDHDTIGIVAALLTAGDFAYAKEYLATLPAQLQYDDAKWKYSWPYAVYLSKTGDYEFLKEQFDTIKGHTHNVETDRIDNGTGIIKKTNAIDSQGYWLIDNWSALAGLSTYQYICNSLYVKYNDDLYQKEIEWAQGQYDSLLEAAEKAQRDMREKYQYPFLSIDMNVPTEQSKRSDVRDANWASMFLFGRWAWDGYLFGADHEGSDMISLIDDTYTHGFERRANSGLQHVGDTIYNFGGYPHGYYSSAYNAGYGSTALRGEEYRDVGIKAYQFMIEKAMSGPFGWWEGVDYPSDSSPWDIDHARGGGGSCQHMWGQSTATKVLIDSLIAEKVNDKIMIGRGIPEEWIADGQKVEVSNHVVEQGKTVGYAIQTSADGKKVTIDFTGDKTDLPFSIELISFKNNIKSVSGDFAYNQEKGTVSVPGGTKSVTVTLGDGIVDFENTEKALKKVIQTAEEKDAKDYTASSYQAMTQALAEAKEVLNAEGRTTDTMNEAAGKLKKAIDALVTADTTIKATGVKLNKSSATLTKGDKDKLIASVTPANVTDKNVTWESSNPSVASVEQTGDVRALKAGKTTIKATAADGSGKAASCTVTVYNKANKLTVRANGHTLNKKKLTLQKGKKATLNAKVATQDALSGVTYKTNNKKVATVSSKGVVHAKKAGTAKITITSKDKKYNQVYTVKVVSKSLKADKITSEVKKVNLNKNQTYYLPAKLSATAKGKKENQITSTFTYRSKNSKIAKVNKAGEITGKKKGTTTIIVKNGKAKKEIKVVVK